MRTTTAIGTHRHLVTLQNPGAIVADADGNWTQIPTTLGTWYCSIEPATARDLERRVAGTVIASATHVLKGRYVAGVTTQTKIVFQGRTFNVTGVANVEERSIDMEILAVEMVV
jgi:head-tail adaptor